MPKKNWHDKSEEFWTPEVQSMDANVQLDNFLEVIPFKWKQMLNFGVCYLQYILRSSLEWLRKFPPTTKQNITKQLYF